MNKICKGLFFILLNFTINIGTCKIGLIPSFLGYYYLIQGFSEMSGKSPWFQKGISLMQIMVPFSMVTYALDLFGLSLGMGVYFLGTISLVASLYVTYLCVQGVLDIERIYYRDFNGAVLKSYWKLLVALNVIGYGVGIANLFSAIAVLIELVVSVIFVVKFKETKDKYLGEMF